MGFNGEPCGYPTTQTTTGGITSIDTQTQTGTATQTQTGLLMHRPDVSAGRVEDLPRIGLAHFAVVVGDDASVDALVGQMRADGHPVIEWPRRPGDGYYEAVVIDPDGNRIEITAFGTVSGE